MDIIKGWFKNFTGTSSSRNNGSEGEWSKNDSRNLSKNMDQRVQMSFRNDLINLNKEGEMFNRPLPQSQSTPVKMESPTGYRDPDVTAQNVLPDEEKRVRTKRKLF